MTGPLVAEAGGRIQAGGDAARAIALEQLLAPPCPTRGTVVLAVVAILLSPGYIENPMAATVARNTAGRRGGQRRTHRISRLGVPVISWRAVPVPTAGRPGP